MKFKSILIYCPHKGLFCSHVTTFVGNNESEIELATKCDGFPKFWGM